MNNVKLIGDSHIGNLGFQEQPFKHALKGRTPIILMGDIIEGILPSDVRYDVDNSLTTQQQYEKAKQLLKGANVKMILSGNHEEKLRKKTGMDIIDMLAKHFGWYYPGHSGFVKINGKIIYATHGTGGGMYTGSWMSKIERLSMARDADIFASGHSHRIFAVPAIKEGLTNKPILFCNSGSYLKDPKYAEDMGLPPLPIGHLEINLKTMKPKMVIE